MSLTRLSYNRKRRSDDESCSSDSEEEVQTVKRSRIWKGEPNLGDAFCHKFRTFVNWIYQLPVSREKLLKHALDGSIPIDLDDDDDDIDIVEINTDDDDDSIIEVISNSGKSSKRNSKRNSSPISIAPDPLSSSTPVIRTFHGRALKSFKKQHLKEFNGNRTYPIENKQGSLNHQKMKRNQYVTPVANPHSGVEMFVDTKETPGEESDDLEIVSEIPNVKSPGRLTRQTVSPLVSEFEHKSKEYNGTSSASMVNGKTSHEEPKSSFTALEVIRLQEKAHYQSILNKMMDSPNYRPIVPKKDFKPAETQIDLTDDDALTDDEYLFETHLKKEKLEKPVDEFLKKYYKPCQNYHKVCAPPKQEPDLETLSSDDDVQIIDTELSDPYKSQMKDEMKKTKFFSNEWIQELKKTINKETEERLKIVAVQEEKLQRYRERRDENILRENIMRGLHLRIPERKEDLPKLTPEMYRRIEWALKGGYGNEVLSTFKDCTVTRNDMMTLDGLTWLNDSVINFYQALIKERNDNHPEFPHVYCFNSYFYTSLKNRGPKSVMRWTRKIKGGKNLFQFDLVLVPLHLGMHWALCVIDNRTKEIKYYDSMHGKDIECLHNVRAYLVAEKQDKLNIAMEGTEYSIEQVMNIPQQMNGSDCGMFSLKYAEYIARDVPITFNQTNMEYFRKRMVIEILDKKLFDI